MTDILLLLLTIASSNILPPPVCHFTSMGTNVKVFSSSGNRNTCKIVKTVFEKVEKLMSNYLKNSEVSLINQRSGTWVNVSADTFFVLQKAREICKDTEGYFNPLLGKWKRMWEEMELKSDRTPEELSEKLKNLPCTCSDLNLKKELRQVKVKKGCEVDLGGIAKGYALDLAKAALLARGVKNTVVDAGGDVLLLRKKEAYVGIKDPLMKSRIKAVVEEHGFKFVCTSGGYERYFSINGQKYPQIFNPFTGWPSKYFLSVTVFANSGYLCDALATGIFAGGEIAFERIMDKWKNEIKVIVIKYHENKK